MLVHLQAIDDRAPGRSFYVVGALREGMRDFLGQIRLRAVQKEDLEQSTTAWRFLFQLVTSIPKTGASWDHLSGSGIGEALLNRRAYQGESGRIASALLLKLCDWPEGRKMVSPQICQVLLSEIDGNADGITKTFAAASLLALILDVGGSLLTLRDSIARQLELLKALDRTARDGQSLPGLPGLPGPRMETPSVFEELLALLQSPEGLELVPNAELLHLAIMDGVRTFKSACPELLETRDVWATVRALLELLAVKSNAGGASLAMSVMLELRGWLKRRLGLWVKVAAAPDSPIAWVRAKGIEGPVDTSNSILREFETLQRLSKELAICTLREDIDVVGCKFQIRFDLELLLDECLTGKLPEPGRAWHVVFCSIVAAGQGFVDRFMELFPLPGPTGFHSNEIFATVKVLWQLQQRGLELESLINRTACRLDIRAEASKQIATLRFKISRRTSLEATKLLGHTYKDG